MPGTRVLFLVVPYLLKRHPKEAVSFTFQSGNQLILQALIRSEKKKREEKPKRKTYQ